ncbi:MAG: glycosyltransferase [Deltaproteobacteria bacterium]|nr:glycosyltransferase [Deltaproteobacteria bacterium]
MAKTDTTHPHHAEHKSSSQHRSILFLTLDFPRWHQAKNWGYTAHLAIEEALQKQGCTVVTLPLHKGFKYGNPASWLTHIHAVCKGMTFDQVWVEMIHIDWDDYALKLLSELAPIRVGLLSESLTYSEEACRHAPHLRTRREEVIRRLASVTHVVAVDEYDALEIEHTTGLKTFWSPGSVPEDYLYSDYGDTHLNMATFNGAIYGQRNNWLEDSSLHGLLCSPQPLENDTPLPGLYDNLNEVIIGQLQRGDASFDLLQEYLDPLRKIRKKMFSLWLETLRHGIATVNLPSFFQGFPGRVFEGMAARRPVLSWEIPNRPKTMSLFQEEKEILLYNQHDPTSLARQIERLRNDHTFALEIANNAAEKVARHHTTEHRVAQILHWIETGREADYGELEKDPNTFSQFGRSDDVGKSSEGSALSYEEKRAFSSDQARKDAYYINLFTKDPYWSAPDPNEDEKARWSKISSILTKIIQSGKMDCTQKLRILDVGCGRGWLTHLASSYGIAEGVDPAAEVIATARRYFPNLNFCVGDAKTILTKPDFHPYDIVLASEVIEHVPRAEQAQFVRELSFLTRPGGCVILTTPRAEVFDTWMKLTNHSRQPVDDWLSEEELHRLFLSQGFGLIAQDRIYIEISSGSYVLNPSRDQRQSGNILALYQVWGIEMERMPCLSEKKECRNTATERPKNLTSTNGWTTRSPIQAHFLMIDKCNAKCIMCGGNYFNSERKRLITLEKFKRMAANLKLERFQKIVLAGAGDPLLNPSLIPIIQYINDRYSSVGISITTNGIALTEEKSKAFLRCKISDLNISINAASRRVYKRIMQVDCFDRVCENARRFVARKKANGPGPLLQFSAAINRLNIEDLPALVELGREIGIDALNIFYTRFYPERIRHLNVDREEDRLNNQDSLFYHQELSDQMVEKAKSLAEKYGIRFFHEPLFKEYAGPQPCVWPETQLMVGFDGEIYPCGGAEVHFKEKVEGGVYCFGNALTHSIEEFWNGEMYRALRISSKAENDCPIAECKVCANRTTPNDEKSHIMHWDAPSESTFKKEGERIDEIRKEEPEGGFPLVSVIVPTYNRPAMLVETLRSILNQTYSNHEIIVVNDAGADVENVVTFLNQSGRMTYVRHGRNLGLAAARNTGIKIAKGKYIAYLDDDDLYYPDHLETLVHFLEGNDYKVAYTDAYRAHQKKVNGRYAVVKQDVPYSFDFDYDRILVENFVPVLCFMHEKSCLDEAGLFDEELTTLEDWHLWIRMSRKFKFAHIPKVTCEFSWREDGTTMTGEKKMDFLRNKKRIYEKYREYSKDKPGLSQAQETFLKNFDESIKREYDRIQQLIKKNLMEEAILALEKLLILSPTHSLAHDDLGVLYFHRGDKERALEHFIQSLKADPKNQNAMKNMADLRMELGQMKEALQLYQMVLADQPMDVEALLGVGNVCLMAGRPGDAKFFYTKVLEIEPENDAARQGLEVLSNRPSDARISEWADDPIRGSIIAEKTQNRVSIIILTHNQLEYTKKCVDSIFKHTKEPFELIVVDNGSTDGTVEYLESEVRGQKSEVGSQRSEVRIKIIKNSENLGFAIGNNQGMAEAKGDYIVLMNNDVVVTPDWLERLIACAERSPRIGIVGPMSNYVSGPQLVKKVGYDTTSLAGLNKFSWAFAKKHADQAMPFWRVVGFCMLIKRAVIEKIGGLDGRYGLGNFEDDDFSLRAALSGFESWIAQDCFVHHFGNRTFAGAKIDYRESLNKNWEIYKKKWGIPADVAYGAPYDMALVVKDGFIPAKHYCPLTPQEYAVADGEKLFEVGDIEGSKRIFEQVLSTAPNNIEPLNNLGVIAFQQGDIDQATSYFTRVLDIDPDYFEAIENLGKCMEAKKDYAGGIKWFKRAVELRPDDISLLNSLGNCFIQTEDFASAREVYEKSLGLDSSQESVAMILQEMGRLEEAAVNHVSPSAWP